MSTRFYYHDESESWFYGDEIVSGSPEVIEYDSEAEWNKELIKFCLETKVLPAINGMTINAILLNPQKHPVTTMHYVAGGSYILSGRCHLYPTFRDGFEIHTTLVSEWLPGGIVKTHSKVYLIELATLKEPSGAPSITERREPSLG